MAASRDRAQRHVRWGFQITLVASIVNLGLNALFTPLVAGAIRVAARDLRS